MHRSPRARPETIAALIAQDIAANAPIRAKRMSDRARVRAALRASGR
jgi:hypothetical protein